jgi:YHS domain-containing protein
MRLLIAHAPLPAESARPSIQERIESSVLRELFSRAGEAAWLRLLADLMAKSGLVWPAQDGLPETLSPEEIDRLREKHRGDIRRAFLAATPAQQADLIRGEVETWTYGYPAMGTYLWLQTALRGVAAALCAQYFAAALELWIWRSPEIDGDLVACLDNKLEPARKALRGGLRSLAEALDLSARIDEVCERTIPSMVWKRILPQLDWGGSGQVAPPVSVLAMGLSRLDPVCGMFLTSGRVAERAERAGETLYFCSRGCRERFEANPS